MALNYSVPSIPQKAFILASKDTFFANRYYKPCFAAHRFNAWWLINGWKENPVIDLKYSLDLINQLASINVYLPSGVLNALEYCFYIEWERFYKSFRLTVNSDVRLFRIELSKALSEINPLFSDTYDIALKNYGSSCSAPDTSSKSVAVVGRFYDTSGISQDAKELYSSLCEFTTVIPVDISQIDHYLTRQKQQIYIFCLPIFEYLNLVGKNPVLETRTDFKTILYAPWELSDLPDYSTVVLRYVDCLWASSRFTYTCYKRYFHQATMYVPFSVRNRSDLSRLAPVKVSCLSATSASNHKVNINPSNTTFLVAADINSWSTRKNPHGALLSFIKAFSLLTEEERIEKSPKLVFRMSNSTETLRRIVIPEEVKDSVLFIDQSLSDQEFLSLLSSVTAVISLHRSEGYGRVPAEAMNLGVPCILTGYSGVLDYANSSNSYLVDYTTVKVRKSGGYHNYTEDSVWAQPCSTSAAHAILSCIRKDDLYNDKLRNLSSFSIDRSSVGFKQFAFLKRFFFDQ